VTKLTASIANVEHKILMDNFFSFSELYDDWLCKQQPFLGNGSVNTFPQQQIHMQQQSYCWKQGVFYVACAKML
jgi:hypothetical protein